MHGVFDIIGPVMIGPSSSHTAGAVRLGLMARKVLGGPACRAGILLAGSFAQTYRGHGTDKALIAGVLGMQPDDERIRDALSIAKEQGLEYAFQKTDIPGVHPNTAEFHLTGFNQESAVVRGASVGGGNIIITKINDYDVEITGRYPAIVAIQHDQPGVIMNITSILGMGGLNIAFMHVSRKNRGEEAMTILELDEEPLPGIVEAIKNINGISQAFSIPAIG